MENIKKEKNNHVCLIISFVLMIVVEIYSFLVSNIFNVFIFTSILFYFLEQVVILSNFGIEIAIITVSGIIQLFYRRNKNELFNTVL